jgi:tetratricopeptide (TPR) repeat protein
VRSRTQLRAAAFFLLAALVASPASAARENSTDLYRSGARLAMEGQLDKSILVFKRVVEISPYYCMGHYGLGKAYLHKYGMLDDAIRHLKTAVQLDHKLVKGYFYLGMAYFLARNYVQSAGAFKNAFKYDNTCIEALYNLGVVYEIIEKEYDSGLYYGRYLDEKYKVDEDIIF